MANKLKNMKFDEVSFVKRGANQHADVVLFKSETCEHVSEDGAYCSNCGDSTGEMAKMDPMECDHTDCVSGMNYCPECGTDSSAIEDGMGDSPENALEEIEEHLVAALEAVQQAEKRTGEYDPSEESSEESYEDTSMYVQKGAHDVEAYDQYPTTRRYTVLSKSDLPEALAAYIEGDFDTEITEEVFLKGVIDLASDALAEEDYEEGDALSKAAPEIQELVAKAQAEAAQAVGIAKAEQDRRITGEFVSRAGEFENLPIDPDAFGPVLKRLFENSPSDYADVSEILGAANAGMGVLFKAAGQDIPSSLEGTSLSAIEKAAEGILGYDSSLTPEQAYDLALRKNPNLYTDSLEN
ncbi:hypothetical protein UFOVP978_20 [uncultured Caudovirales phage]|uniref:Uncharacterized protein n=1 Tax=uncultured Caudovirales phage TaxID=2100421 RepID=A0A6J5Q0M2_9CAUD|nr:hypothetical protein UFOVP978_20 [uncultured Caudovirales phage]